MRKFKAGIYRRPRETAELELIIEEFGQAMRNANEPYIARLPQCEHDLAPRFTGSMEVAWAKYVEFCRNQE